MLCVAPDVKAAGLFVDSGGEISKVVRGEAEPLSAAETKDVLEARMSYYANDLTVVGWNAAFVYDTENGAVATTHLLEYANSQLLQFRHYDDLLTRELNDVYAFIETRRARLARWRMLPAAHRLQTSVLDVTQLP